MKKKLWLQEYRYLARETLTLSKYRHVQRPKRTKSFISRTIPVWTCTYSCVVHSTSTVQRRRQDIFMWGSLIFKNIYADDFLIKKRPPPKTKKKFSLELSLSHQVFVKWLVELEEEEKWKVVIFFLSNAITNVIEVYFLESDSNSKKT